MDKDSKSEKNILDANTISIANAMFYEGEQAFPEESNQSFVRSLRKGWLTSQYFSKGKHDLVLPAWLLGKLGPKGKGKHGIAGMPILHNSDLRSYIALGSPDSEEEPVIDHKGGIIPIPGSYTLMFGTLYDEKTIYASEAGEITIELNEEGFPIVTVYWELEDGDTMVYDAFADKDDDGNEALVLSVVRGFSDHQLFVTMTPFDQDGITKLSSIEYDNKSQILHPGDHPRIKISEEPIRVVALPVVKGHAGRQINSSSHASYKAKCEANAASWAAAFPVRANPTFTISLSHTEEFPDFDIDDVEEKWESVMDVIPEIDTSNEKVNKLFRNSAVVLRLLADIDKSIITVGPSLQEKTWIPALTFQTKALDRLGFSEKIVRAILDKVYVNIDTNGFAIKNKQWDSQGMLIYAFASHFYMTNDVDWLGEKFSGIKRIIEWFSRQRKRKDNTIVESLGLLPIGNALWYDPIYWKNDFYYSHNFWGAGAIDISLNLSFHLGRHGEGEKFKMDLEKFKQDIDDSISKIFSSKYLPAGPLQRDNVEMLFNLYSLYPLKLYLPEFQPLSLTVDWLLDNYVYDGGLLIDQPWNAYGTYLSCLLAQACRYLNKNTEVFKLINFLIKNTTNDQGWAEGISPLSLMGSVGDSPNGFAAAEWINLILDLFAEQFKDNAPVLLQGMPVEWLKNGVSAKGLKLHFHSVLSLKAKYEDSTLSLEWDYQNPNQELLPHLVTPYPIAELDPNIIQVSTYEIILQSMKGSIKLKLEDTA